MSLLEINQNCYFNKDSLMSSHIIINTKKATDEIFWYTNTRSAQPSRPRLLYALKMYP